MKAFRKVGKVNDKDINESESQMKHLTVLSKSHQNQTLLYFLGYWLKKPVYRQSGVRCRSGMNCHRLFGGT